MKYKIIFLLCICIFATSQSIICSQKSLDKVALKIESQNKDSISRYLQRIVIQNDRFDTIVNNQTAKIEHLNDRMATSKADKVKDFLYSFILSILSAIIFWLTFSFFPNQKRKKKIRPIFELDMYTVYSSVFSIFDLIMRAHDRSPSSFQSKIRGGKLTDEDIELGLQNKCINATYLFDSKINGQLIVTGERLYEIVSKIDLTVEHIFGFSSYLSAYEVLILERIRKKLQTYDLGNFNNNASVVVGGEVLYPVNSSISYMKNNFHELYDIFLEYQVHIFKILTLDRDITINKVQYYFYSGQLKKCIRLIDIAISKYPNDISFLSFYSALCQYNIGSKEKAYEEFSSIFNLKPHLVSSRGFLKDVLQDDRIKNMINSNYEAKEIMELDSVLDVEEQDSNSFIENAKKLRKYYKDKTNNIQTRNSKNTSR